MILEIDYNPSPSDKFFISVEVSEKEAISFDNTTKGCRIITQILAEKKPFPTNAIPSGQWESIVLRDGKFFKKYKVKWIDLGKKDWCNNEIWETVSESALTPALKEKLLKFSRLVSDNYDKLDRHQKEVKQFETLISAAIMKLL